MRPCPKSTLGSVKLRTTKRVYYYYYYVVRRDRDKWIENQERLCLPTQPLSLEFAHPLFTDNLVDKINYGDSVFEQCNQLSVATIYLDCRNIETCC